MRVLVLGAGAVGGFFGAKLAAAGHAVVFTARGAHLEALRREGLAVESGGRTTVLHPLTALPSPRGAGPFDLALVCVKAPDTAAAVAGLDRELAADAVILSLQNGVEGEALVERALGCPPLLGALVYVGAELVAPGRVRHTSGGTIVFGERDGTRSARVERLEACLREAGIGTIVPADVRRTKWEKLAWNASLNLVAALSGAVVGEILREPAGRRLAAAAMREVEAVARAEGAPFAPDYVARLLRHAERNLADVRPSTLQDREKGKPLEHDALCGAVVRFGERHGIDTPVARTLDALAALVSARARAAGS